MNVQAIGLVLLNHVVEEEVRECPGSVVLAMIANVIKCCGPEH